MLVFKQFYTFVKACCAITAQKFNNVGHGGLTKRVDTVNECFFLLLFQVFNLGDYRRNVEDHYQDHSYFDPNNEKAAQMREQVSRR